MRASLQLVALSSMIMMVTTCGRSEPGLTERHARERGFESRECSVLPGRAIYVAANATDQASLCDVLARGIDAMQSSELVSTIRLPVDSVVVAVIDPVPLTDGRAAATGSRLSFSIAFDISSRTRNILVAVVDQGPVTEVSWVPEGLRY